MARLATSEHPPHLRKLYGALIVRMDTSSAREYVDEVTSVAVFSTLRIVEIVSHDQHAMYYDFQHYQTYL